MYSAPSQGAEITITHSFDCDYHKKRFIRVATPDMPEFYQPIVHYDCLCNQERALQNRVLGVVPLPTQAGKNLLRAATDEVRRSLPIVASHDVYELANRHTGAKHFRYLRATERYLLRGVCKTDAYLSMFVKAERIDPGAKVDPDPRAIQYRSAVYCVALSQHLRPCEEVLYQYDEASDGVPRTRNVAKSLNQGARAALLVAKARHFTSPVFVGLDMSRFDKHVSMALLKLEAQIYQFMNPDGEFSSLLRMQLVNKGFTRTGIKYKVKGKRMSGDMNTAIGNVVLMLLMLIALCRIKLRLARWDCIDDGDDAVVIIESSDLELFMSEAEKTFLGFGMVAKVEAPVSQVFDVEFCQSKVVEYAPDRYKFVRDYRAVISKSLCGIRHWDNDVYRRSVIRAIGTCELALSLGVPVLQAYAVCLIRNADGSRDARSISRAPDGLYARAKLEAKAIGTTLEKLQPVPILECARDSFAKAFGIDKQEQLRLERFFGAWVFRVQGMVKTPLDLNVKDWDYRPTFEERYPVRHEA